MNATPEAGAPEGDAGTAQLSRSEQKNVEAREALVPLKPGERPRVVTVGAVIAGIIALIFIVSTVIATVSDTEVQGEKPSPVPLALFAAAMTAMAVGMWRGRYWAVLGFQALLVLFMLAATVGLLGVQTIAQGVASLVMLAGSATLFYFMVKALARIEMPDTRRGADAG